MQFSMNRRTPSRHEIGSLRALPLLVALPLLLTACPKPQNQAVIRNPATLPPQAKVVTMTCPQNQYLRGGRHQWRDNGWHWENPRCTRKTSTWRDGCVWLRGRWVRQNDRIGYVKGHIRCPGDPDPRLGPSSDIGAPRAAPRAAPRPTSLPPNPPSGAIGCGPDQYLRVGRYIWKDGTWRWLTGRCARRPADWKASCKWHRGRWRKTPTGLVFSRGRLVCP